MGVRTTEAKMQGAVRCLFRNRSVFRAASLTLLAVGLGGCSGMSDFSSSSVMVVPGKYNLHGCQEIEANIRSRRARDAELEKLMAQASTGAGGEVVNLMVYRTDYLQNRGELAELVRTAADKQCSIQSPWTSGRTIF
jgi:hypothetical protein